MDEINSSGYYREHIGDGVYVSEDGYHMILEANVPVTDKIYLDYTVRRALYRMLKKEFEPDKSER